MNPEHHFIGPGNVYNISGHIYVVVYCWSAFSIEIKECQTKKTSIISPSKLRYEAKFIGQYYKEKIE